MQILNKSNFDFSAGNVKTWDSSQSSATSPAVFNTYGGDYRSDFSGSNIAKGKTWISSNYWSPRGVAVTFDSTVTITKFLGKSKNLDDPYCDYKRILQSPLEQIAVPTVTLTWVYLSMTHRLRVP